MKKIFLANNFNTALLKPADKHIRNYQNPENMVQVLEEELGAKFSQLRQNIRRTAINVSPDQVQQFLEENYPDITFDPKTYQYFQKNVEIFRNKSGQLFDLINNIVQKQYFDAAPLIDDLDLNIDKYGYLDANDAKRLVVPAIYNYTHLQEFADRGNNLVTYADFHYPHVDIARGNIYESEIYPCEKLQINNLYNELLPGNVNLSPKQACALNKQYEDFLDQIDFKDLEY